MTQLWASSFAFLAIHLLVAGTVMRARIVGLTGERPFLGLFSLASVILIGWLVYSYNQASALADNPYYWAAPIWAQHLSPLVILIAAFFVVIGITTPNPTAVAAETLAAQPDIVRGMLRITRHPFLWGVAIWALWHLLVNGDKASIIFFGTFALLSILGTFSIDRKKQRRMGEDWTRFADQTSNFPFAAIATGRNVLRISEIGSWRVVLAFAIFGGLFYAHLWLFGVSPVPGWHPY